MPSAHALLSPSAAHRWLHCTPSAVLASKVEDKGSSYAEEGTCAHALCELRLLEALGRPYDQAAREFAELSPKWHTSEMDEAADLYASIVLQKWDAAQKVDKFARIYVERRLDFSSYAPESFGTADCTILADGCMEVIDFKYGKGVEVSAEKNPQMMIYALGAYDEFSIEYDIKDVCMTIVQPRIGNVSEYRIPLSELLTWGESILKPAADAAFKGEGELFPGDHCRFCPVKAVCSALALKAIDTWRGNRDIKLLSPSAVGEVLKLVPMIEQWAATVKEHGLALALEGNTPEGFKLVEGRSNRVVTDPEGLWDALLFQASLSEEQIFKPRELKSIGELEKACGKKKFGELSKDFITKPAGKPTLVAVTDKRQEIHLSTEDAARADFTGIETE